MLRIQFNSSWKLKRTDIHNWKYYTLYSTLSTPAYNPDSDKHHKSQNFPFIMKTIRVYRKLIIIVDINLITQRRNSQEAAVLDKISNWKVYCVLLCISLFEILS